MDVKHVLDVVGAALLALVTLPLQLGAAVAVWITMGSPILFRQSRAGRHGRPFQLVKLRSMSAAVAIRPMSTFSRSPAFLRRKRL